ncbi:hypothetical protein IAT38_006783 [Cryptococcus sp. DSM 104549]
MSSKDKKSSSKDEKKSASKDKKSSSKDEKKASSKDKKPSSSSRSSKPKSSDEIREEESSAFIMSSLSTHAPLLTSPVLQLSSLLSTSPLPPLIFLLSTFFLLHLYTPLFLLPHLSAVLTLACPIYGTALTILGELGKRDKGKKTRGDGAQWLLYWAVYVLLGWGRGAVGIWAPGWKGVFELGRDGVLVVVGGGWFSREGMMAEKSKALLEAEKREAAAESSREKGNEKKKEVKKDDKKDSKKKEDAKKNKKKDGKDKKKGEAKK